MGFEKKQFDIICVCSGFLGMLLNALQINLLRKEKKKTGFMLTIFSLSVADFLQSLVFINIGGYYLLVHGNVLSKSTVITNSIVRSILFYMTSSLLHVVLISVERFLAVYFPLRFQRLFTTRICKILLIFIWLLSIVITLLSHNLNPIVWVCCAALFFTYLSICVKMFLHQSKQVTSRESTKKGISNRETRLRKIVLYSCSVTMSFIICNLPKTFAPFDSSVKGLVSTSLLLGNVLFNPILYFLHNRYVCGSNPSNSNVSV